MSNATGFFDRHPWFYESSRTGAQPNRLNSRHRALIECNRDLVAGRRILDLGSHDGRWSFAALCAGAVHVTGVEGRVSLVERARANMVRGGMPGSAYTFLTGDMLDVLPGLSPASFDTVFCFGVLYHTIHHASLLASIVRLGPGHVIIDTNLAAGEEPIIQLQQDYAVNEGHAIAQDGMGGQRPLVGFPSRSALELLLRGAGLEFDYLGWRSIVTSSWEGLADYRDGLRVTVRAAPAERRHTLLDRLRP